MHPGADSLARLSGIVPALVTPLDGEGQVDVLGLGALIGRMLTAGVAALSVAGSTGEGPLLPPAERRRLVAAAAAALGGRLPLLAAVVGGPPGEVVDEARDHLEAGAAGVLVPPPSYFELDQAEVLAYYEQVASRLQAPIVVYHFPALTKVSFEPETVGRLAGLEAVVGIKDSSADAAYLGRLAATTGHRPGFRILAGSGRVLTAAFEAGACGAVAASANVIPGQLVRLWAALTGSRTAEAAELQEFVSEVEGACRRHAFPANWKAATELSGLRCGGPTSPLRPLPGAALESLREALAGLGVAAAPVETA